MIKRKASPCAPIAQLVEQLPRRIRIRPSAHSLKIKGAKYCKSRAPIAQLVEQLPLKEIVPGSNPGGGTRREIFCPFIFSSFTDGKEIVPGRSLDEGA